MFSAGERAEKDSAHALLWESKDCLQVRDWQWKQLVWRLCEAIIWRSALQKLLVAHNAKCVRAWSGLDCKCLALNLCRSFCHAGLWQAREQHGGDPVSLGQRWDVRAGNWPYCQHQERPGVWGEHPAGHCPPPGGKHADTGGCSIWFLFSIFCPLIKTTLLHLWSACLFVPVASTLHAPWSLSCQEMEIFSFRFMFLPLRFLLRTLSTTSCPCRRSRKNFSRSSMIVCVWPNKRSGPLSPSTCRSSAAGSGTTTVTSLASGSREVYLKDLSYGDFRSTWLCGGQQKSGGKVSPNSNCHTVVFLFTKVENKPLGFVIAPSSVQPVYYRFLWSLVTSTYSSLHRPVQRPLYRDWHF